MLRFAMPLLMLLAGLPALAADAPAPMPAVQKISGVRLHVREITGRVPKNDKCASPATPMIKEGGIEFNRIQTYAGGWLKNEKLGGKVTEVEYSQSGTGVTIRHIPELKVCNELDRVKAINVLLGLAAMAEKGHLETDPVKPSKDETRDVAGHKAQAYVQSATAGMRRFWAVSDPVFEPLVEYRKAEYEMLNSRLKNPEIANAITQELRQPSAYPDRPAVILVEFKAEGCDAYRPTFEAVKVKSVDVLESEMKAPECRALPVNDYNRVLAGGAEALRKIDEEAADPKPEPAQQPGVKAGPEKARE